MTEKGLAVLIGYIAVVTVHPAQAQIPVTDLARLGINVPEYIKVAAQLELMQNQLQQAIKTVQQAQQIYNAANQLTNTNSIATGLNDLRTIFPGDGTNLMNTTASGGMSGTLFQPPKSSSRARRPTHLPDPAHWRMVRTSRPS